MIKSRTSNIKHRTSQKINSFNLMYDVRSTIYDLRLFCYLLAFSFFLTHSFAAEVELEITKQAGRKTDLAYAPLKANSNSIPSMRLFNQTFSFDLDQSGYFELLKNLNEIQNLSLSENSDSITQAPKWRSLGADLLVKGAYSANDTSGSLDIYAFDVESGRRVFGKRYAFDINTLRSVAHTAANDLVYRLTGERGISGTRIAYVAGSPQTKEVFISDTDGTNVLQLTQDKSIVLGVNWSPDGNKLLYTSFKQGQARIYLHDLTRGVRQSLAAYPGLNAAAKFSPDGSRIAMVLSKDGNPEIYFSDLAGRNLKRITNHPGVDSSPSWSPDGRKIVFVSNRSGRPHIYIQDLKGGPVRRMTYQGAYNSSPAWSPNGDKIAFSSDMEGGSKICVLDLNDETITIVNQEGGEADEPEWAPDGRHIIYSSKIGGVSQLFIVDIFDGKTIRLSVSNVHYLTPAWSF